MPGRRCQKKDESDKTWLRARVAATNDINCHRTVLDFGDDSLAIRAVTGLQAVVYVTKGFPVAFNVLGQEILVQARHITPAESFFCATFGANYPVIVITDVRVP